MSVTIYGHSDDVICASGDISDEWDAYGVDEPRYVATSNGCVFSIRYDRDGFWRIAPVIVAPACSWVIKPGDDEDTNYSDRLTVDDVTWVAVAERVAR